MISAAEDVKLPLGPDVSVTGHYLEVNRKTDKSEDKKQLMFK